MEHIPSCAAGVPIFRLLPEEGLAVLAAAMRHRHYARGELIASAGDPIEQMSVVAHGRLKLVRASSSGREQVIRTVGPGEFIGELALFSPAVYEGDLLAMDETDCCLLPRQAVQTVMQQHPASAMRLVEALANRLSQAEETIVDLGIRDVGQRLAAELLRATRGCEPAADGSFRIKMPVPWAELAFQLGTTPESLSRRLKALADDGLITQEGTRTVIIRSPERLKELVEG